MLKGCLCEAGVGHVNSSRVGEEGRRGGGWESGEGGWGGRRGELGATGWGK